MRFLNLSETKTTNFDQTSLSITGVATDTYGVYSIWTRIEYHAVLDGPWTWEVMTIPTNQVPTKIAEYFVCNGVPTTSDSNLPGWEDPSSTFTGALTRNSQNLVNSIVLGYATEAWYEGAILRTVDIKE